MIASTAEPVFLKKAEEILQYLRGLSYEGIAFRYMAPDVFEDQHFEYVQKHLRILSGLYGVLKPHDDQNLFSASDAGVNEVSLQHDVVVHEHRHYYDRVFRNL